jgi:peroxiredoxin
MTPRTTGTIAALAVASVSICLTACVEMEEAQKIGSAAPAFSAKGTDGKTHTLASLSKRGPVVLYFIKDGCPVNHRAAPFLTKLTNAYGANANVVGVFNGDTGGAKNWAKQYGAKYLILADKDYKIIRSYKAVYSPWLIHVGKDGKIAKVYEGASPANLAKVNEVVASAAGAKLASIDFSGAPNGGG